MLHISMPMSDTVLSSICPSVETDKAHACAVMMGTLWQWADDGLLRYLDVALAAFVQEQDPSVEPCVLVATALLAHMEGRGHSCLALAELVLQPTVVLGWASVSHPVLLALWQQLPQDVAAWLAALACSPLVRVAGRARDTGQPFVLADDAAPQPLLYLRRHWHHERAVAQHILARRYNHAGAEADNFCEARVGQWLERFFPHSEASAVASSTPARCNWQKIACAIALRGHFAVITGGPGTGKTYTAARLLALWFALAPDTGQLRVALAAPTGKAAARLRQSISNALRSLHENVGAALPLDKLQLCAGEAKTLHALLGARPDTRQFQHHAGHPLDVDVLIVDEASMIHLEMMSALLDALPAKARLVLLGDKDQLASVEAGAVLGDLCRDARAGCYSAETVAYVLRVTGETMAPAFHYMHHAADDPAPILAQHTVMLRDSHRFGGPIGQLAEAVNAGHVNRAIKVLRSSMATYGDAAPVALYQGMPVTQIWTLAAQGRGDAASYAAFAVELVRWPDIQRCVRQSNWPDVHAAWARAVLQAFDRFRLLCAVREGEWGVAGLNHAMEQVLAQAGIIRKTGEWYSGRPVMVTHNDAALGVFNGDIGIALPSQGVGHPLRVYLLDGDALRSVGVARLAHVETAFAMTVHKSQGSEFEHTALVLGSQAGGVLGRELVYTGITRARQHFTLLAQRSGLLHEAIASPTRRTSGLQHFLSGMQQHWAGMKVTQTAQ